ncbi:hypothetical protein M408DRAFT_332267 [Serendipita vermifera MAFF 305830]|uniref:Nuclear pore complex protein Nup85 n=1 Tax=Serendipita vermifera MAFF 305830 TaxID=933852 RepID=A0A0C3AGA6_SERVB|nr:hypothetical protein M408DRAFT_332267 [Serendipita vermifera MAFF 305830]
MASLYLQPPLIPPNGHDDFIAQNHTVKATLSARSHGLAVYESYDVLPQPPGSTRKEGSIYFAQWGPVPTSRRKFITDTYVIWDALRKQVDALDSKKKPATVLPICYANCQIYTDTLRKHIIASESRLQALQKAASSPNPPDPRHIPELERDMTVLGVAYTSLTLLTIIFVPSHGAYNAVVGRELLHWHSSNFLATLEEEGTNLLKIANPWLAPTFWTFIKSCTLRLLFRPATHFLRTLSTSHSHPATREISALLVTALNGMPNSEDYDREADYFDAHRQWKTGLHRLQRAVSKHATGPRYEGKSELEELVALVGGDARVLVSLCNACGMGWRDAICVYGIWIQPSMTRTNLPNVVAEIIEEMPVDTTSLEDQLHAALFAADIVSAARLANDIDVWLVAHMVDILEALPLPEGPVLTNLRLHFLMDYGEHLMADPSNWRVAASYLLQSGQQGFQMANEILISIPFRMNNVEAEEPIAQAVVPVSSKDKKKKPAPLADLDELIAFCSQHGLQDTVRSICRVASNRLTSLRLYGKAVEYCGKTSDVRALNRVIGSLSNEYLLHGATEFVLLVDKIPRRFMYTEGIVDNSFDLFTERLKWLVTYAEFHYAISRGERTQAMVSSLVMMLEPQGPLAPIGWWGLILVDIGDFLEKGDVKPISEDLTLALIRLEEVTTRSKFGVSDEYLWALIRRYGMKGPVEALARLERVRFTLVLCAAKTMGGDAGGKGNIVQEKWMHEADTNASMR